MIGIAGGIIKNIPKQYQQFNLMNFSILISEDKENEEIEET